MQMVHMMQMVVQHDANGSNWRQWCSLVQKMHKVQMVVEMVVQMLQISANWCKWRKLVQIGENGVLGRANWSNG